VKNNILAPTETESLLDEWRQERAFRVVRAMSRVGLALAVFATFVDIYFQVPTLVFAGDLALMMGCAISLQLSTSFSRYRTLTWSTLYVGLWIACMTSLATTGGLNSPFNGSYWVLMYLGGLLIQVRFRPFYVSLFILGNLGLWMVLQNQFPNAFGEQPPMTFSVTINSIVLVTVFLFVSEFMKTERDLGQELLRRYKELNRTREDLSRQEEANLSKNTFFANVSHELRTPLGAILGYAELMQAPDIQEKQKEKFADTIHRNGLQLSRLVDDLLDLSKAEAGKIEIELSEFSLKAAINEVIDLLDLTAQQKGVALKAVLQEPLPELIVSDSFRFKQILRNIIGNAIKFTTTGHINVVASLVPSGQSKAMLQIEIEDSGCGLSAEEQKRIFKAFSQADASITRKFGGTGLGLNLSRNLAQILGGDLRLAWSQKDVGSCFVLQLPLKDLPIQADSNPARNFFVS